MRLVLRYALVVLVLVDVAVAIYSILEAPFPSRVTLGSPLAYRNIYVHVPIAFSTYLLFTIALAFSVLYLVKGVGSLVALTDSFILYGLFFAAATLVTGSAWASESWGTPWNWDPKQTAVLLLFMSYLLYFPVKSSIGDPERRDRIGAIYVVAAYSMVPLSFLASRLVESLHPTGQAISEFAGAGSGGVVLGVRILLVLSVGILLALSRALQVSYPKILPVIVLIAGMTASIAISIPLIGGGVYRVIDVEADSSGYIHSVKLSNGDIINFNSPIPSPIEPPLTPDGVSTLIDHLVKIRDGGIEVVYHWSTPFSLAVYSLLIAMGLALTGRRGGSLE